MPIVLAALVSGLIFGFGLAISGMTQPTKVLGFLDVLGVASGTWDPTLAFVMLGALAVVAPGYLLARRRERPLVAKIAAWPTKTDIDRPLVAGGLLFLALRPAWVELFECVEYPDQMAESYATHQSVISDR